MDKNEEHIEQNFLPNQHEKLFKKLDVSFSESKEDIWEQLEQKIDEQPVQKKVIALNWKTISSMAASLIVFITLFIGFYTKTITTEKAEHLTHQLPDGSQVELNAETSISYKPYFWNFSRAVSLHGEAFFKVQKGEKFQVISEDLVTEVLGTSFNIYARNDDYRVFCKTGMVKVSSDMSTQTIKPNQLAVVTKGTVTNVEETADNVLFWQRNLLLFKSQSIDDVLAEIERQFDVTIIAPNQPNLRYSGKFDKKKGVETILNMISLSLNLKVKQIDHQNYTVSSNQ